MKALLIDEVRGLERSSSIAVRSHKIPTFPYAALMFVFASKNKRVKIHSTFIRTKPKGTPFGVPEGVDQSNYNYQNDENNPTVTASRATSPYTGEASM